MEALSQALYSQGLLTPKASPYEAIRQASDETGIDFDYLWRTAQRESGLNPNARAETSSATGLFQFTDATWLKLVERYGEKHALLNDVNSGVMDRESILEMRTDPVASARLAAELAGENRSLLRAGIGREPTSHELYAAHFLGPSGAAELIREARIDGERPAEDFFPRAARANRAIFTDSSGEPRSLLAVYARLTGDTLSDVDQPPQGTIAGALLAQQIEDARRMSDQMTALLALQVGREGGFGVEDE